MGGDKENSSHAAVGCDSMLGRAQGCVSVRHQTHVWVGVQAHCGSALRKTIYQMIMDEKSQARFLWHKSLHVYVCMYVFVEQHKRGLLFCGLPYFMFCLDYLFISLLQWHPSHSFGSRPSQLE